jgi:6-phosphogluconolactonase
VKTKFTKSIALASLIPLLIFAAAPVFAAQSQGSGGPFTGSAFIMSNSPTGNYVLAFGRSADGILSPAGAYPTGGLGASGLTGTNQGGLALSSGAGPGRQDLQSTPSWLFVVNAGSNDLSVFHVSSAFPAALSITDRASSGGTYPISVTVSGNWVYVLNAGTSTVPANIAGYYLTREGTLISIPGSVQPLSGITQPAQISFNPSGTALVVTEKSTGLIDTYTVNEFGVASAPTSYSSSGSTPFGFAFNDRGFLVVSDAASGALSSYSLTSGGVLTSISGPVSDGQAAPCWVAITADGRYAYTTDAHSSTISSYVIGHDGSLTLLQGVAATTGTTDTDMAMSSGSRFLYIYDAGANEIQAFNVHLNGQLSLLQTVSGIPAGADGLVAN